MIQTFTFIFQKTDITWMLPCCQPDTWEDIYCHFGILQSKEQTSNLSDGVCKTVIKILIDDLFNGAFGNVIGFERNKKGEVFAVIVKFDQEKVGAKQREENTALSEKYKKDNGTPIFKLSYDYNKKSKKGYGTTFKANVLQFPLRLAWGSTSHSMQVIT